MFIMLNLYVNEKIIVLVWLNTASTICNIKFDKLTFLKLSNKHKKFTLNIFFKPLVEKIFYIFQ